MGKLKLLMAVHSHQPVGNFDNVFEEAYQKAYLPFVETLERHPDIKITLHYSGSLIEWLEAHRPDFISRIAALVSRKQAEILSGGYYEPILALLPKEDRINQVKTLNAKINNLFDAVPCGAWLTERVWEPDLASDLNKANIKYTIVDDVHFEKTGRKAEDVHGYYLTEEEGKTLAIFPGSKFLRYAMPFKLNEEIIRYFENFMAEGKSAITFADDGEKFGLWPHTYKWVYQEKWLDNFFEMIEHNSNWIETSTLGEYLEQHAATGRIYLPCASYSEMLDWSNGYFKNFLIRYPESNNMHKRMLEVSKKISDAKSSRLKNNPLILEAEKRLYMSQSNDGYWHGVFGGLYLNHLRHNVYSNLIRAEETLNNLRPPKEKYPRLNKVDFNCDGKEELVMENKHMKLYLDLSENGSIFELDYKDRAVNIINTLARRKERYHDKIKEKTLRKTCATQGSVSIHNMEKEIPDGFDRLLVYDRYHKSCLLEYFLENGTNMEDFLSNSFTALDSVNKGYELISSNRAAGVINAGLSKELEISGIPFSLKKNISMDKDSLKLNFQYLLRNKSASHWSGKFVIEFNFSLWDDALVTGGTKTGINNLSVRDSWFGIELDFKLDKTADVWHFPIETVYESEKGFEKNFQALSILFSWNLNLAPDEIWAVNIAQDIKS